jgi:hypothetical protein
LLAVLGTAARTLGGLSDAIPAAPRAILERYCLDCHDDATAKARFSLESLATGWTDRRLLERWVSVHDRLSRHEMPPEGKPQPPEGDRNTVLAWLGPVLAGGSRQIQRTEGRAGVRRLNRLEYASTLQDLLAVNVELEDLLPPDRDGAGFNKVPASLEVSPHLLTRCQLAASRVLSAAVPKSPPVTQRRRFTGREWYDSARRADPALADLVLGRAVQLDGDTALLYAWSPHSRDLEVVAGTPAQPGRYRIRASVSGRGNPPGPVGILFFLSGYNPENDPTLQRVLDVRDAPAGKPTIIEVEFEVPWNSERWAGRSLCFLGWSLPEQRHPDALRASVFLDEKPDFSGPALALDWVEFEGPLDPFPGIGYRRLFGDLPLENQWTPGRKSRGEAVDGPARDRRPAADWARDPLRPLSTHPRADAERLLRAFAPRVFRGAVNEGVIRPYLDAAFKRLDAGEPFADAMIATYEAMLCSLDCLLLAPRPGPLDDDALASRLSYFLWSSCPDEALAARAARGELRSPGVLRQEVRRMLADARSARFIRHLAGQWLDLRKLYETRPDLIYVEFGDPLLWSMPRETERFLGEMFQSNRSIVDLVASDWSMLNAPLARHYGIPGVLGWELQRTPLPANAHRGGLITQAAVLKVTANGTTTSPVLRGKWVLDRLLGQPARRPPPDTPAIDPDIRGATTIRQQLEKHRSVPSCAECHRWIDPPGFALESFDVIGGWREFYRVAGYGRRRAPLPNYPGVRISLGLPVEPAYETADGKAFQGIDDYRRILAGAPDVLVRNLAVKLITYATGAEPQFADRDDLEAIVRGVGSQGLGLRSLVEAIVESRMFLEK